VRLIGKKGKSETFPLALIKRVRLVRRADGDSVQFAVQAERKIDHRPTGKPVGIDVGLKLFYTDSQGHQVDNPR
jgi:putative transposase